MPTVMTLPPQASLNCTLTSLHCCWSLMCKHHPVTSSISKHRPARRPHSLQCLAVMSSQGLPLPRLSDPKSAPGRLHRTRGVVRPAHELGWREGGVELSSLLELPWACSATAARRLSCSCLYSHLDRLWASTICLYMPRWIKPDQPCTRMAPILHTASGRQAQVLVG